MKFASISLAATLMFAVEQLAGGCRSGDANTPSTHLVPATSAEGSEISETEFQRFRKVTAIRLTDKDPSVNKFSFGSCVRTAGTDGRLVETDPIVQRDGDHWRMVVLTSHGFAFCIFGKDGAAVADPARPGMWLIYRNAKPRFEWHRTGDDDIFVVQCTTLTTDHRLDVDLDSVIPPVEPTKISGPLQQRRFDFEQFEPKISILGNLTLNPIG